MIFQRFAIKWFLGVCLGSVLIGANVSAEVLLTNAPSITATGTRADRCCEDELSQIVNLGASTITTATWWGYYLIPTPADTDFPFDMADRFFSQGIELTTVGTLARSKHSLVSDIQLYQYDLVFSNAFNFGGGDLLFALKNDSDTVQWFWQGSGDALEDGTGRGGLSLRLEGTRAQAVPEPGSLALVGLALAGLAVFRTRARTRR